MSAFSRNPTFRVHRDHGSASAPRGHRLIVDIAKLGAPVWVTHLAFRTFEMTLKRIVELLQEIRNRAVADVRPVLLQRPPQAYVRPRSSSAAPTADPRVPSAQSAPQAWRAIRADGQSTVCDRPRADARAPAPLAVGVRASATPAICSRWCCAPFRSRVPPATPRPSLSRAPRLPPTYAESARSSCETAPGISAGCPKSRRGLGLCGLSATCASYGFTCHDLAQTRP